MDRLTSAGGTFCFLFLGATRPMGQWGHRPQNLNVFFEKRPDKYYSPSGSFFVLVFSTRRDKNTFKVSYFMNTSSMNEMTQGSSKILQCQKYKSESLKCLSMKTGSEPVCKIKQKFHSSFSTHHSQSTTTLILRIPRPLFINGSLFRVNHCFF